MHNRWVSPLSKTQMCLKELAEQFQKGGTHLGFIRLSAFLHLILQSTVITDITNLLFRPGPGLCQSATLPKMYPADTQHLQTRLIMTLSIMNVDPWRFCTRENLHQVETIHLPFS